DNIERFQYQVAQIVVDHCSQLALGESVNPRSIFSSPRANLGHNDQIVGIWKERLSDDLIGDVRAIEVGSIYMIYAARDGFSQHADRFFDIVRRSPYSLVAPFTRKLHGSIAHTVQFERRAGQSEAAGKVCVL